MNKHIANLEKYIHEQYPLYEGWEVESICNGYQITGGLRDIVWEIEKIAEKGDYGLPDFRDISSYEYDLKTSIEEVEPPEGCMYVTIVKDGRRVGLNIPRNYEGGGYE